jgi:hypothetical protein
VRSPPPPRSRMAMATTEMAKRVPGSLPVLAAVAIAATAAGAYAAVSAHRHTAAFSLTASPGHRWIVPGATARYRIYIHRRFAGPVRLRLTGVPRYATARVAFLGHSHGRVTLTVLTSLRTRARRYWLRMRATHGRLRAALRLSLIVDPRRSAHVTVAGNAIAPLWPGIPEPIDIALSNPGRTPVRVTGLTVAPTALTAPRATSARPCSLDDFTVQQFTGGYPIVVLAHSTRSLAIAGIPQSLWPQVEILNRSVNQNGCQGATLKLAYTATAGSR